MNKLERKMVEVLKDLKENHHVCGIKAEFEAEGTRLEEAMRLKEVITVSGLGLTMKIGGCEAIRDMYEARVLGVERIVAPMIETAYALNKYLKAAKTVFPPEERELLDVVANIETIGGCNNFDAMLDLPDIDILNGVVMGRVDLTGSMGLGRDDINTDAVFEITQDLFTKAKAKGLECAVGGGVGKEAIPFFHRLGAGLIDRYETRKLIFNCPDALNDEPDKGILKAVGFELLWLKNKRDYYGMIYNEDMLRIEMLESRYKQLIEEAGGKYE